MPDEAFGCRLSCSAAKISPSEEAASGPAALVGPTSVPATPAHTAGEQAENGQQDDGADEGDDDLGDQ